MIVLDTNVLSELRRPNPDLSVINWFTDQVTSNLHMTTISEAKLRYGVEMLPAGRRREKLMVGIERLFRVVFAGRILPFDSRAARSYAAIAASRRAAGRPISQADCQIAAIAHSVGASIATRNVRDFEGCGVDVINPWSKR